MNVDRLKFALAACRKVQSENGAEIRFLNLWAQLLEEIAQLLIEQHDPTAVDGHVEVVEQELPPTRLLLAAKAMLKKFEADALASPEWEALDDAVRDAGAT